MTIFSALCIQVYDKLLTGIPFKIVFTILYLHNFCKRKTYFTLRVITKLPNSEESYKGKVKTHKYINSQNQSTTGKL